MREESPLSEEHNPGSPFVAINTSGIYGSVTTPLRRYLCPDLLRFEDIGAADNLRGHVVRGFFWLMRAWPV